MPSHLTTLQIERMSGYELLIRGIAEGAPLPARLVEWDAESGLVYVIGAGGPRSPIKIGYCHAWGLDERLSSLQTGNPYKLKILARGEGYLSSEQRAHYALRADRLTGEWFRRSRAVASFVKALNRFGVEYAIAAVKADAHPRLTP